VLVLVLAGPWVATLVFGAEFRPAGPLLTVLGPAAGLDVLQFFLAALLLALDRPGRLLAGAGAALAASLVLTPLLVRAEGLLGGALALGAVTAVAFLGSLVALAPLVGLPMGAGALKAVGAAAAAGAVGSLAPDGPWRAVVALVLFGAAALVLRPVPALSARRLRELWPVASGARAR
jgi:O-antigen/teichoic acid export membrane protein